MRPHGIDYLRPLPHQRIAAAYRRLERMDRELSGNQFVAGDRFTIADIRRWSQSTIPADCSDS
jgi:glutathione S-transferase